MNPPHICKAPPKKFAKLSKALKKDLPRAPKMTEMTLKKILALVIRTETYFAKKLVQSGMDGLNGIQVSTDHLRIPTRKRTKEKLKRREKDHHERLKLHQTGRGKASSPCFGKNANFSFSPFIKIKFFNYHHQLLSPTFKTR